MTFVAGSPVVWRSVVDGEVGSVLPAVVARDDEHSTVLYQRPGTTCMHRTGPGGEHAERVWTGPGVVRIHPRGAHWSVLKGWDDLLGWLPGWYVKLEVDWVATPIGVDSRDLGRYVITDDRISRPRVKGPAEPARAVRVDAEEAGWVEALARRVTDTLRARRWPFAADLSDLAGLRPDPDWPVPPLPDGWRRAGRAAVRINPLDAR